MGQVVDDPAVVSALTESLDASTRKWRSPEEHALALLEGLRSRGWSVVVAEAP